MKSLVFLAVAGLLTSCGVVGAPVPPESVGVAVTIEEQKKRDAIEAQKQKKRDALEAQKRDALEAQQREAAEAAEAGEPDPALQGQDENLPPLQPVGTR